MDKDNEKSTLTSKQLKAIPIILASATVTDGMRKANLKPSTFYLWSRHNLAFKAEYERQRDEAVSLALGDLKGLASKAVTALRKLLDSEQENIRLKTATEILNNISKFMEYDLLDKRITFLEKKTNDT